MSLCYEINSSYEDRPVHKISVYSRRDEYILIGFDRKKIVYSVLRIKSNVVGAHNNVKLKDIILEKKEVRSEKQISEFLQKQFAKNELKFVCKAYAILGFIKLLQGYYMLLVTEAEAIAKIESHKIYRVNYVSYVPLFVQPPLSRTNKKENRFYFMIVEIINDERYLKYLKSFDLTNGFYFSDTYDLTNTFQTNVVRLINNKSFSEPTKKYYHSFQCSPIKNFNEYFMWNYYLAIEFDASIYNKRWITPFIYGYVEQIKVQKMVTFNYQIILISRRSRHHAGTRYLTRGMNPFGFVGNFVETEQIVIDLNKGILKSPVCSSFVQVRGSAPFYWYQETKVVTPKPPIHVNPAADISFEASRKHFADLYSLYGPKIFALNLVKKKEVTKREQFLTELYQQAVDYLNIGVPDDTRVIYYHQDMKALLKKDKEEFLNVTNSFGLVCLSKIGFFSASLPNKQKPVPLTFQTGVIRSSCVDCLDRTNTFQQLIGESALSLQVGKIYGSTSKNANTETFMYDTVLKYFREMYGRMGDVISLQYGGSIAHKTDFGFRNAPKQIEFFTSLKRYYSNTFTDQYKQNAINLFLGVHKPCLEGCEIWNTTAPIIWKPNSEALNAIIEPEEWWRDPLEEFNNTISISNDPEAINKALNQAPVVDLDLKDSYIESLHENFSMTVGNSRRVSVFENFENKSVKSSMRLESQNRPDKFIWFSPDRFFDLSGGDKSKIINNISESDFYSNAQTIPQPLSPTILKRSFFGKNLAPHAIPSLLNNSKRNSSEEVSNSKRNLNITNLNQTNLISDFGTLQQSAPEDFVYSENIEMISTKTKKTYNFVLNVDEKFDESDDKANRKPRESGPNRVEDNDLQRGVLREYIRYEDGQLYEDYCTFFKKNTDDMFDDENLKDELITGMKLDFEFENIKKEFIDGIDIEHQLENIEEFSNDINTYLTEEPVIEIKNIMRRGRGNQVFEVRQIAKNVKGTEENYLQSKTLYNLTSLRNVLTSIYPSLQRPNIMKA